MILLAFSIEEPCVTRTIPQAAANSYNIFGTYFYDSSAEDFASHSHAAVALFFVVVGLVTHGEALAHKLLPSLSVDERRRTRRVTRRFLLYYAAQVV